MHEGVFKYLQAGVRYVDDKGAFREEFRIYWQEFVDHLNEVLDALETVQDDILAAQNDITAAQAELASQLAQIQAVTLHNAISSSWTVPTRVLTAEKTGTGVGQITIENHTRRYDDGQTVSITGGIISSLTASVEYAVYYDDETRSDTTPTFVSTTTLEEAQANYASGRHYLGTVSIPSDSTDKHGGPVPPGSGYDPYNLDEPRKRIN